MTIKGFADKYNIPYHTAYQASYGVKPVSTMMKDREYPEKELFDNLVTMLHNRQFSAQKKMEEAQNLIRKVNGIAGKH